MMSSNPGVVTIANKTAFLWVDSLGGALTAFQLNGSPVNPLNFIFSQEQMPANNRAGSPYQGHFACIGRWGEPSTGEIAAGIPNHGEPANGVWMINQLAATKLTMQTRAIKEGLEVSRTITMDPVNPVFSVEETVTNINPLGRLFNLVQHPTLAAPFLDDFTIVNCNAEKGFDQSFYRNAEAGTFEWPEGNDMQGNSYNLEKAGGGRNGVYSFVVNPLDDLGWITAFSPTRNLVIGYVWPRSDYPWIHIWRHYNQTSIKYLGIEFGTAGIHQPFEIIIDTATKLFGQKTFAFIDAGESSVRRYTSFTFSTENDFSGVENIKFSNDLLVIRPKGSAKAIHFQLTKT